MDAETVLSYFLISAGAALFLPLTFTQIVSGPIRRLKGGALLALFLIVIGLCMGILSSPLDRDPIFILREFMGLSYGPSTLVRTFSLLLVFSILLHLAVLLYTAGTKLLLRIFSVFGAVCALLVIVFLTNHDTQAALGISEALALHGLTLEVNACVTGYALFCLSLPCECDLLDREKWPLVAFRVVLVVELLTTLAFALYRIIVGGLAVTSGLTSVWISLGVWFLFLFAGAGGSMCCLGRIRAKAGERPAARAVNITAIIALICSFVVNGVLQTLVS